jgi:hypothetical protein
MSELPWSKYKRQNQMRSEKMAMHTGIPIYDGDTCFETTS